MNEEEILKAKEEEQNKDSVDTLPTSEPEEVNAPEGTATETEVPELNSEAQPTEEQVEAASIGTEGTEAEPSEPEENAPLAGSEPIESAPMTEEQKSVEEMFTQSQVNDIVGRTRVETRDKTHADTLNEVYGRYGVKDEAGLDDMAGRSQKYDLLREDYDKLSKEMSDVKVRLAMYDSGIAPERYEDARLILTGKGLEVTPENIKAEMETHPEWKKVIPTPESAGSEIEQTFKKIEQPEAPVSKIDVLGNENAITPEQSGQSERESALNMFK